MAGAIGIVIFVHYAQRAEKAVRSLSSLTARGGLTGLTAHQLLLAWFVLLTSSQQMHAGVIRDYEQQRVKRERQADFEMQRALEEEYRKVQTVSDGGGPAAQGNSGIDR